MSSPQYQLIRNRKSRRVGYALIRSSSGDMPWQVRMLENNQCAVIHKDVTLSKTDSRPGLYLLLTELEMNSEVFITSYKVFGEVITFKSFLEALSEKECTLCCAERDLNSLKTYQYPTLNPDALKTFINVFDLFDGYD